MRVRTARPRRNVQQCEQELLHSAAPILTNTLHGLNPKMLPNPSIVPGRELRPRLLNFEFNTTRNAHDLRRQKLLCCSTRKEVSTMKREA